MFCKQCGKQLPAGAQFCTGCGAQLGAAPPAPVQAPVSAPVQAFVPAQPVPFGAPVAPAPAAKMSPAKLVFLGALAFTGLFALIAMIVYLTNYGKYSGSSYSFAGWSEIGLFLAAAAGLGLSFTAMRDNVLSRALPPALFALFGLADAISIIAINANVYSSLSSYYAYSNTSNPLGGIIAKNIFLIIALLAFNGIAAMLLMKRIQLNAGTMVVGIIAALLMIIMGFICNTVLFGFAILFFVAAYLPEIIRGDIAKSFAASAQTKLSAAATQAPAPAAPAAYQAPAPVAYQAPAAPVAYQAPVMQAEPAGQFCPVCGKALPAGAEFCTGCGNKMQQ